jgi:hypothetical protein
MMWDLLKISEPLRNGRLRCGHWEGRTEEFMEGRFAILIRELAMACSARLANVRLRAVKSGMHLWRSV